MVSSRSLLHIKSRFMFSTLLNNSKQFNVFKWRSFYYLCMEKTCCLLGTEQREKLSNLSKNIPWTWCAFWMIVLCSWEQLLMDFFRFQTLCQNYIDSNNKKNLGWSDGSVSKGIYCQVWWPEIDPYDAHERRLPISFHCPLTSKYVL